MKYLKSFILSTIFISGCFTPIYAANPVSKEYVDLKIDGLQTQINNILSGIGTSYTAGDGISINDFVITNSSPGITYTAGSGISIVGNVINNNSPGITYTAGSGISIVGNVISNNSPGVIYTGGTGISVIGTSISATTGVAEFTRIIQTPNISVPVGTAFTIDTQVFNTVPSAIVLTSGDGGSVFVLSVGTYILDYETSLVGPSSIGIYTGANAGSLVLDTNSVAGSTTATTWIHGRVIEVSTGSLSVGVSPVDIAATVTSTGTDAAVFMIRLTILKIA
jgi:hypothetical protein